MLGTTFDSWNGEAFYTDKMPEVVEILEKSGHLEESNGAKIINLEDQGINTPCMVIKSNGSTTYDTRDLAAVLYRARTYDFDKCLYVVAYEQDLHFRQIFASAKYLGLDEKYLKGLEHISYGMVRLKTGKMSTREGTVIKLEDLLNESIQRVQKIIEEKNPDLEDKEEIAKKIGIGAVIFNNLATGRIKDQVFDWDEVLNFQGETGPYIQYTYVRTKSVLEKVGYIPKVKDINVELEINMPLEVRDENKEEMSKVGIINSYKEFLEREKKLSIMGVIRIGYYMITAAILLSCWYIIKTSKGESLLTSLLNSGGTVLLWQIMTLIFIEGRNFRYKLRINRKLSNMNIVFKYI